MTKTKSDLMSFWVRCLALAMVGCLFHVFGAASAARIGVTAMSKPQGTLWELVDSLGKKMPFSRDDVETQLNIGFNEVVRDEYMMHLRANKKIALENGISVTEVNFVLDPNGSFDDTSGMTLGLHGTCIKRDEVSQHYANLQLTQVPRGRSLQEEAVYTSVQSWGSISFGFRQEKPSCLATVTFRR